MIPHTRSYLILLISFTLLLTLYRVAVLYTNGLDLVFDESQYWYWAKHLDFGYYSKPPMVAWLIALTTSVCGDGEACIRLSSPILHALTSIVIFAIGNSLYNPKVGFYSGLTYLTLPAVAVSSLLVTTDAPFLFFWSLALLGFVQAIKRPNSDYWWLVGIAAGFGLLSKYSMAIFLISAILCCYCIRDYRPCFRERKPWYAALLAFLIFLPNLIWNASNGFVSFLHTKDNANVSSLSFHFDELLEFIGAQFLIFGPILTAMLLLMFLAYQHFISKERSLRLLFSFVAPFLLLIAAISLLSRAHANWAAPVYVAATIMVVAYFAEHRLRHLIYLSIALHLFLGIGIMHFDTVTRMLGLRLGAHFSIAEHTVTDPFKRLRGQKSLGRSVAYLLSKHPGTILLSDDRKTLASLSYYVPQILGRDVELAKWNQGQAIKDHYALVADFGKFPAGSNALLISPYMNQNTDRTLLYFNQVSYLEPIVIRLNEDETKTYYPFYTEEFLGY